MIGIAAARTSFEGSSALLRELAGLVVAPKTVERHAEALGREIAGDECRAIEPEPSDAPTLYLGLDGTGVPARKTEVEGPRRKAARRQRQDPRGQARRRVVGGNHRPGGEPRARSPFRHLQRRHRDHRHPRHRPSSPRPSPGASSREAERRGFDRAGRRVILGDGAPWIWNLADEHFPRRDPDRRHLPRQGAPRVIRRDPAAYPTIYRSLVFGFL